tara:strand:+ start:427 stop:690 length:264 start_codon:yes stop_codon:yes gene_type:complete
MSLTNTTTALREHCDWIASVDHLHAERHLIIVYAERHLIIVYEVEAGTIVLANGPADGPTAVQVSRLPPRLTRQHGFGPFAPLLEES